VRLKDPTEWIEDLTVFLEDEEVARTAELMEPELLFRGSKIAAAAWLSVVATAAGIMAALSFSPGIRSIWAFAAFLAGSFILLRGLRPATDRVIGRPVLWLAKTTFFWAVLIALVPALSASFHSPWLAYGLTVGGGFFVGMMHGSLTPNCIKREDAFMTWALALGPLAAVAGTALARASLLQAGPIVSDAFVGGVTAALFSAPLSAVLFRYWDEAHGCRRMAMLYLHNDNFAAKAVAYLDRALALQPDDPELYNLRGVAFSKMDQAERAAADWRKAAELAPDDSGPLMNVGVDHLRHGKVDEAIDALKAALQRDAMDPTIYSNLGTAFEKRGDLDQAIANYDKAIELRPDYANAYSNRGYARHRKGDHQGALSDCDKALELNPHLAAAHVNRGHALSALRDYGSAAECYRSAIEVGAGPELRAEIMQALEAMKAAARAGAAELSPA
jgi:Flp pilus assembly protein TadD